MQTKPNKYIQWTVWLSIGLCALLALASWLVSYISFEWVKEQLDALAVDGNADNFTPTVFAKMTFRLQLAGCSFAILSIILTVFKTAIQQKLQTNLTGISFLKLYRDTKHHTIAAWAELSHQHQILLLILFITGIVVRICFLFQPMRHDEAFTFTNYASKPLLVALSNYSFPNNHLFHTFLVHMSYLCFGNHEWAIRLPAFFAGILFLPVTYLTVQRFYNHKVALLSLALTATASPLVEYSINARGYIIICLFFFLLLNLAHSLQSQFEKTRWIIFTIIGALGLYTIPIMIYPLGIVFIWCFRNIFKNNNIRISHLILSGIGITFLTSLFYTPILLGSGPAALFGNRFVRRAPSWESFLNGLLHSSTELWQQWTWDYPLPLALILVISLIIGCLHHLRQNTVSLVIALPTCLFLLILQRVIPPERTWLFLMPLFFAWAANGLIYVIDLVNGQQIQRTMLTLLTVTVTAISLPGAYHNLSDHYQYGPGTLREANQITQMLAPSLTSNDRVLTIATAAPLEYYFNRQDVSIAYLRKPISDANRIILIVMESKYTLEEVLTIGRIPSEEFTPPKLWHRYNSAAVYTLQRQFISPNKI